MWTCRSRACLSSDAYAVPGFAARDFAPQNCKSDIPFLSMPKILLFPSRSLCLFAKACCSLVTLVNVLTITHEELAGTESQRDQHFVMCCGHWDRGSLISSLLDAGARHFYHFCDTLVTGSSKLYGSLKNSSNYIWREEVGGDSIQVVLGALSANATKVETASCCSSKKHFAKLDGQFKSHFFGLGTDFRAVNFAAAISLNFLNVDFLCLMD